MKFFSYRWSRTFLTSFLDRQAALYFFSLLRLFSFGMLFYFRLLINSEVYRSLASFRQAVFWNKNLFTFLLFRSRHQTVILSFKLYSYLNCLCFLKILRRFWNLLMYFSISNSKSSRWLISDKKQRLLVVYSPAKRNQNKSSVSWKTSLNLRRNSFYFLLRCAKLFVAPMSSDLFSPTAFVLNIVMFLFHYWIRIE